MLVAVLGLSLGLMDGHMFRARDDLKIARRVVKRITVFVMDLLISGQFATKKTLYDNAMLWLVVAIAYIHIAIAVFDVLALKYAGAYRLTVALQKRVMILAQPFSKRRKFAALHAANRVKNAVNLPGDARVAVFVPPAIVGATHSAAYARLAAPINCTIRFLFWHNQSIVQERF